MVQNNGGIKQEFQNTVQIFILWEFWCPAGTPWMGSKKKVNFSYRRYISHVHVFCTNLCLVLGPAVEVSPDWPGEITTQAVTHWDQEPRVNLLRLHRTYKEATEINSHSQFSYPNEISFNPHWILPYTILISKWYDSDIINALIWDDTKKNQKPITGVIWKSYNFDMKIISYKHQTVKLGYSKVVGTN